ncbi:MAG: diacylglycerol/lipid kinase family protein [Candidatus Nanopelagicales bacterium]
MRGLLVVNPNATTTTPRAREVLVGSLAHQFHLETTTTNHRGHAAELGAQARKDGVDCVIVFGGDGTVNEVVNGMVGDLDDISTMPVLGVVPGGSANVFSRSLGYPQDPIEATGQLIASIREQRIRTIGLGRADKRWFLCNAGLGMDAEIIAAMEEARSNGQAATPTRYLRTSIAQFFRGTDRKVAPLAVIRPGQDPVRGIFLAIVQNCSPWTYLGALEVNPSPDASFDTGLDLWAIRSMSISAGLRYTRRLLTRSRSETGKNLLAEHDLTDFTIACQRPTALQVDGESLGDVDEVHFTAHKDALRVFV